MATKKATEETKAAKTATKTAAAKTTAAKTTTAKTKAAKTKLFVQFGGKSYEADEFAKMAKDVWTFDLKRDEADLKTIELYAKPEEGKVYYVFNGSELGSFDI